MAKRPIHVCFMIDRLLRGGTESQLVALIDQLDRARVVPHLCLLDGEDAVSRALEPRDCPVLRLGVRALRHPRTIGKALRLTRFLREHAIDVLQVYFPDSTYLGVLVGRLAGVPHLVRTRNNLGHSLTPTLRGLDRVYRRLAPVMIANCEACRQAVMADEGHAGRDVVVLENGVNLERFVGIPPLASRRAPRRVGVVANLRAVKGLHLFLRAAAAIAPAHPEVTFQIAGEGEQRAELERLALELRLDGRVQMPGSVRDIPRFLAGLDLAVLPSRSEGMSNALLEYMAAGRAIVATAVGANPHVLHDGVHGLVVPPNDVPALAAAIDRLLRDPTLAGQLAAAAKDRAWTHYSREAMVRRFEDFYHRLVNRALPARSRPAARAA